MSGSNARTVPVSVVIPTLGGDDLFETVQHLNGGSVVPTEIMICIPEGIAFRPDSLPFPNVRIVRTQVRGQVTQRIAGFREPSQPFVMQLDDDVWLDRRCMELLLECIRDRPDAAASPSLLDRETGTLMQWMSRPMPTDSALRRALFRLANGVKGYQPGRVGKAGVGMGFSDTTMEAYEVEWVPGGCTLHHRGNLVIENFYPFTGKAYAEDLFHSWALRQKNIGLLHCPSAMCRIDNTSSKSSGLWSFLRIYFYSSRALMSYAAISGGSRVRLLAFLLLWPVSLVFQRRKLRHAAKNRHQ